MELFAEIILNEASYYPGAILHGMLHVDVVQAIEGGLKLKFQSAVRTSYTHDAPSSFGGMAPDVWREKEVLLEVAVPFMCWQPSGQLLAGQHWFPFSLQLPCDLQPSFAGGDGHCSARLTHELITVFEGEDCKSTIARRTVRVQRVELPHRPGTLHFPTQHVAVAARRWCLGSGSVTLSVFKGGPDVVAVGQQLSFGVDVDNYSTERFKGLRVELVQEARLRCHGERLTRSATPLLAYDLGHKVKPGQAVIVMDPTADFFVVPEQVQPSVSVKGWLKTTHRFCVTLVNAAPNGLDLSVESGPITILSRSPSYRPLPPCHSALDRVPTGPLKSDARRADAGLGPPGKAG